MSFYQEENYERLSHDLAGPREEVALVVRGEDGVTTKTVAVFHNAAVRMENAGDYYNDQGHLKIGKTVTQIRVTTDTALTIYSEDYFAEKG